MTRIIRAKFYKGVIKPLEDLDLAEGKELSIAIMNLPPKPQKDTFENAAGKWKGTVNANTLIKNIYADRLIKTRKAAKL
jgi:predicted DNA-binding antitoxin AbrB/MazE fold protein